MNLLDAVSNTSEKVTGKAKVLKDINADNYNTKEVILFMSQHLKKHSYLADLNENKLTIHKEFNHEIASIVVVYSGKHYFRQILWAKILRITRVN